MDKITVDLDPTTLSALSDRADQHGHSLDEEVRTIIRNTVTPKREQEDWVDRARAIRAMTPRGSIAVAGWKLVRADRDWGH